MGFVGDERNGKLGKEMECCCIIVCIMGSLLSCLLPLVHYAFGEFPILLILQEQGRP